VEIYAHAIPQYTLGYTNLLAAIEQARANLPTLYFAGNYWQGPSLGACIERATKIAAEIATRARQSN
jgi:protoporphyrinogen oxidase